MHPWMPAGGVEFTRKDKGSCSVFHITGDVDLYNSDLLKDALLQHLDSVGKSIILDLTHTDYLDSTGIGAIVAAWNKAKVINQQVMLSSVSESIRRVLSVMQIDAHIQIFEHTDAALASLRR